MTTDGLTLSRAAVLAVAVALLGASPAAGAPILPAADVQVSSAYPRANYGSAKRLAVSRRPVRRAYIRFDLRRPAPRGARVILQVLPLRASTGGVQVRRAVPRAWDEDTITFRTAPRLGPTSLRSGPLAARLWAQIDVTRLVGAARRVTLALAAGGSDAVLLASREQPASAPRLAIEVGGAPLPGPILGPGGVLRPPPHPPPGVPAPPVPVDPALPCGVAAAAPAWQHVVWVLFENKAYADIMGAPSAPFLNGLAARCASTASFYATARPSLPNYIAMTSGDTHGVTDNGSPADHPLDVPSIFSQLSPDGWRALQESMPANCALTGGGMYAARHNPAAYFTNVAAECQTQDVPLADPPDLSARFTFLTPNLCNGMHDCPVADGDAWLAQWVPKLLDTPQYRAGATAIFITWDEDDGSAAQQIPTFVIAPTVPAGLSDPTRYDHYSLLRTTEEMLDLPLLGAAATASSMRPALGL